MTAKDDVYTASAEYAFQSQEYTSKMHSPRKKMAGAKAPAIQFPNSQPMLLNKDSEELIGANDVVGEGGCRPGNR